jgi:type II secretory pathway pseudopilin PulG
LVKGQKYTAPMGMTVKEDLVLGAEGIDARIQEAGGNAYILNSFEWVPNSYGTQLNLEFDILLYESAIQRQQRVEREQEIAREKAEQERQKAEQQAQQEQAKQAEQTRLANLYRQAGNNVGNLRNTSRRWNFPSDRRIYFRYDFGNGNYLFESNFNLLGVPSTGTGTFRVNGDTVIFLTSEGEYSFGTIIGTTMTIDGNVYR